MAPLSMDPLTTDAHHPRQPDQGGKTYGLQRLYRRVIPGTSGKLRVRVSSSMNVTSNVTSCVMIELAQAADSSTWSPSCFRDRIVHWALFPLTRLPSTMKPEPKSSEDSAKVTSAPFLVNTRLHRSACEDQRPRGQRREPSSERTPTQAERLPEPAIASPTASSFSSISKLARSRRVCSMAAAAKDKCF
jgi:hypothetical protein